MLCRTESDTVAFAQALAPHLRAGDTVCLRGDLGAGKSVLARALIRHYLNDPGAEAPSPTFTLVQTYDAPDFPVWHFDLYRLNDPDEIEEIGWDEDRAGRLSLVEWPERLGHLLPARTIDISITIAADGARDIRVRFPAPEKAFILAAGLGTRLRPYTDTMPKPMVPVAGRAIIDRALDRLDAAGVREVGVNLHYLADILEPHLQKRHTPRLHLYREADLLGTGGALKKALPMMQGRPFYSLNGDAVWTEGEQGALARLAERWDPVRMDILLLLVPVGRMVLTHGVGDYDIDETGRCIRRKDKGGTHMFMSLRIMSPAVFADTPDGFFDSLSLMDRAEAAGRLYALVHDGEFHHISTPADLEAVDRALRGAA